MIEQVKSNLGVIDVRERFEDFYEEPSEFDLKVEEFKDSLLESVKEEYTNEMDRLQKENGELRSVKENFSQIKRDYELKENQLERERQEMIRKVRNERLNVLMSDFQFTLYRVDYRREKLPKCNKCDENRRIYYKTPRGKDAHEMCECAEGLKVFFPQENECYEFRINRDKNGILAWYRYDDEYDTMSRSNIEDNFFEEKMKFEDVNRYRTFFKSKEDCQRYCDWLNENA